LKKRSNSNITFAGVILVFYALAALFSGVYNLSIMHQNPMLTFLLNPFASIGLVAAVLWVMIFAGTGLFLVNEYGK
jgi:hypothetical protein